MVSDIGMTEHRVDMDGKTLCELYEKFQKQRRTIGEMYCNVPWYDFIDNGRYQPTAMPAVLVASEHLLAITNIVNRFCHELHALIAWERVFGMINEEQKLIALFEFVTPLATSCLSLPYSIREMLVKSVCNISHQTNRFRVLGWDEAMLKRDRDLTLEDTKQLAADFIGWPAMYAALKTLNDKEFTAATDDHRNRVNHGFARRIEMGHILTIKRDPKSFVYRIVDAPPLGIGDLIPVLAQQYKAAVKCYDAYVDLVREQQDLWVSSPR